ncbi:MAG: TolC family protein [Schleiferiaceae bacterium]|nr:TolC family protein [Schleiferiaceae bacterium]
MKKYLFSIAILVSVSTAFGQEKWSLEDCVNYALEKNISVQQARLQIQAAQNDREGAIANLLPNLDFDAGYFWNFGLNIDPVTNLPTRDNRQTNTFNLNSNWVVFDGLANVNQVAKSRIEHMASLYNLDAIKNDVTVNVSNGFIQVLLNKELLRVAEAQLQTTKLQEDRTAKLVEAGSLPMGDLYQLQAQIARDEQNLVNADNNLTISKLLLAQLLMLEDPSTFDIIEPIAEIPQATYLSFGAEEIYRRALEAQPIVEQRRLQVESAARDIAIARAGYMPSLVLIGRISTNYSNQIPQFSTDPIDLPPVPIGATASGETVFGFPRQTLVPEGIKPIGNQWMDNRNQFVGMSLRVPIFSRLQVRNGVRRADLNQRGTQLNYEQTKMDLRQTIQRAHADAVAALNTYNAADKSVKANEEAFSYAQRRFDVGAINQVEFETARNNLVQAQSEKIRSKYEYTFRVKVLEFYVTNSITY